MMFCHLHTSIHVMAGLVPAISIPWQDRANAIEIPGTRRFARAR